MCDKVVDFNLITSKFVSDWFVINNMLEKLDNYLFSNDHIFFHDADSNIMTFLTDDMDFNTIDCNNIYLDKNDFDEDDPKIINHVRLMTWHNRFKQCKACKKEISKELMHVAWHPTRCWN